MAFDIGTTGAKTCLYQLGDQLKCLDSQVETYPLITTEDGGAEQRVDDWWDAMCRGSRTLLNRSKISPDGILALSFCCQMQALILVDERGEALRNPMGYMDGRARDIFKKRFSRGLFRIAGLNARKLLFSLYLSGGAAATAKDPLWKYHWVKDREPHAFARACHWLDVRDYLALRCTGNVSMTRDSAHLTFLYDTRPGREKWSESLCRMFRVNSDHLPPVVSATDRAGSLTRGAAAQLGLSPGCMVFSGGGDVSLISIGSGALEEKEIHAYVGTSGWVTAQVHRRMVDVTNFMASICGALPGTYNYVAEQETSGLCLQWVRDHLARDTLGLHGKLSGAGGEDAASGNNASGDAVYSLMDKGALAVPPGSNGVIFTPWFHGNRAPREDPLARGMFFNMGLSTEKQTLIRSVMEGVAFHKRWMLEAMEKKIGPQDRLRLVGGGAKSQVLCQILADVTGYRVEVPDDPQNAGAAGAALVCGLGLGYIKGAVHAKKLIPVSRVFYPNKAHKGVYDRQFRVFKKLYFRNRKLFRELNGGSGGK